MTIGTRKVKMVAAPSRFVLVTARGSPKGSITTIETSASSDNKIDLSMKVK